MRLGLNHTKSHESKRLFYTRIVQQIDRAFARLDYASIVKRLYSTQEILKISARTNHYFII